MGSQKNQDNLLDSNFKNFNFLPQKLLIEDLDMGLFNFIKHLNLSLQNERNEQQAVPLVWVTQELWAERKQNFGFLENENGTEIRRPYLALYRTEVKEGTSPLKYSIPKQKRFTFVKVPIFDGTLKGMDVYKIPQPVYTDLKYELVFESHYQQHVNTFYEFLQMRAWSDGEAYLKVNGYNIASLMDDPSENNTLEINSEMVFQVVVPITVLGKLVDPTRFEKMPTITKIAINITEKK